MINRELINPLLAIAAVSTILLLSQAQAQSDAWPPLEKPYVPTSSAYGASNSDFRRVQHRRALFQFERRSTTSRGNAVWARPDYQRRRQAARSTVQPKRSIDPRYLPAFVRYPTTESPGTIIIDPESRYLYLVLEDGTAKRYGVGVGRQGFGWSGTVQVARKAEWPGWTPPAAMRKRQPELPQYMEGGPNNPLGARALYLYKGGRDTLYRIHGSNEPWTIGHAVSSGCIRMRNEDVTDLYMRVGIGTKVVVL